MTDYIPDKNILRSRKTYGKKKDNRSFPIFSENNGLFSGTASEDFKSNDSSHSSDFIEKLCAEENSESVESVTNIYRENGNIQKDVDSEYCLFNDEDTDYYFSFPVNSSNQFNSSPSVSEVSTSGSKYQRTRKNLKNRISNELCFSEEMFETISHCENSNFLTNGNETKLVSSNHLKHKQASSPAKQNISVSVDSQVKNAKMNGVKSSDAWVKKLNPKSNPSQVAINGGKVSGKINVSKNSVNSASILPIMDLVNRFAASSNQNLAKSKQSNKRKRIKEECESSPAKKISSFEENRISSKVNSMGIKASTSVLNNGMKSSENNLNTLKMPGVGLAFEALPIRSTRSCYVERIKVISNVKNPSALGKIDDITPSKPISKRSSRYVDTSKRSANNPVPLKKSDAKTLPKAAQKRDTRFVDNTKSEVNNLCSPSKGDAIAPNQNNETAENTERSIQMLKKFVSKNKLGEINTTVKRKCPSSSSTLTTSDLHLGKNRAAQSIPLNNADKEIKESPSFKSKEYPIQNQISCNIPSINFKSGFSGCMPLILAPVPYTDQAGIYQAILLSKIDKDSFEFNYPAISHKNYDSSIPGPSTLNNILIDPELRENDPTELTTRKITKTTSTRQIERQGNLRNRCIEPSCLIDNSFFSFLDDDFIKNVSEKCVSKSKEECSKLFLRKSVLLNISVEEFCGTPNVSEVLKRYLADISFKALVLPNVNKGYDFPESFETESFLRVVKDFLDSTISYLIPTNMSKLKYIPKVEIYNRAKDNMSSKEFLIFNHLVEKKENMCKLKNLLLTLNYVAVLVIFDEFENRKQKNVNFFNN